MAIQYFVLCLLSTIVGAKRLGSLFKEGIKAGADTASEIAEDGGDSDVGLIVSLTVTGVIVLIIIIAVIAWLAERENDDSPNTTVSATTTAPTSRALNSNATVNAISAAPPSTPVSVGVYANTYGGYAQHGFNGYPGVVYY
eukprot:NODE_582_length_727_cov_317.093333_g573_i0.p1 GENE.NODE_582_length_727_cov_317.093333_g573_i0~~NODE_582_length_727_cov_317.093333_g573_i0.p1  ORF type:complete len:141 (-),score=19.57 NODE_582_length_727_cov_317.093333_g573_i0:217-639(-)